MSKTALRRSSKFTVRKGRRRPFTSTFTRPNHTHCYGNSNISREAEPRCFQSRMGLPCPKAPDYSLAILVLAQRANSKKLRSGPEARNVQRSTSNVQRSTSNVQRSMRKPTGWTEGRCGGDCAGSEYEIGFFCRGRGRGGSPNPDLPPTNENHDNQGRWHGSKTRPPA